MSEFKKITNTGSFIDEYWDGAINRLARFYAYLTRGFGLVNEAKNYFLIIFGSFWTAKAVTFMGYSLDPRWILVAGILGLPVLIIVGRWHVFRVSKAQQALTMKHESLTGIISYNISVMQLALLEGIAEKLGVDMEKIKKDLEKND